MSSVATPTTLLRIAELSPEPAVLSADATGDWEV
jgi:hypothetical protein